MTQVLNEAELYHPVASFFKEQGYVVKAEVRDCDVLAVKDNEEPIIIELKRSFSISLLTQAAKRKKISNRVCVAVPHPKSIKRARDWRLICETMQIGLLFVRNQHVEVSSFPDDSKPSRSNRKKTALLNEFHERRNNYNVGGTTRTKRFTVYREQAIQCASAIANHPNQLATAREIRQTSNIAKTARIIRDNVYGWFERLEPNPSSKLPMYRLSEKGKKEWLEWDHE